MGFKIIVRKNGVQHGESHYTSEAVAAGMAKKMKNAGADVTLARCNGACCDGMKLNPRFTSPGYVVIRRSGQQDEFRTLAEAKAAVSRASGGRKTLTWKAGGRDENGEPNDWLCDDVDDEIRKVGMKSNPRRNGSLSAARARLLAAQEAYALLRRHHGGSMISWAQYKRIVARMSPEAILTEAREDVTRRNGTTAGVMAASRSLVHRAGLSRNPSMDADTASTLIKQLGGMGKLVAMVGAKEFTRTERNGHPALSFKFKGSTKANYVIIRLDPSDTYTLQFGKIVKYDLKPTGEFHGIYADQLKRTFEKFTGLYLSL